MGNRPDKRFADIRGENRRGEQRDADRHRADCRHHRGDVGIHQDFGQQENHAPNRRAVGGGQGRFRLIIAANMLDMRGRGRQQNEGAWRRGLRFACCGRNDGRSGEQPIVMNADIQRDRTHQQERAQVVVRQIARQREHADDDRPVTRGVEPRQGNDGLQAEPALLIDVTDSRKGLQIEGSRRRSLLNARNDLRRQQRRCARKIRRSGGRNARRFVPRKGKFSVRAGKLPRHFPVGKRRKMSRIRRICRARAFGERHDLALRRQRGEFIHLGGVRFLKQPRRQAAPRRRVRRRGLHRLRELRRTPDTLQRTRHMPRLRVVEFLADRA